MRHEERGKCVVFSHDEFDLGVAPPRKGSKADVDAIERAFGKLGFTVEKHFNYSHQDIQATIEDRTCFRFLSINQCLLSFAWLIFLHSSTRSVQTHVYSGEGQPRQQRLHLHLHVNPRHHPWTDIREGLPLPVAGNLETVHREQLWHPCRQTEAVLLSSKTRTSSVLSSFSFAS